jgi:hypothetical protein
MHQRIRFYTPLLSSILLLSACQSQPLQNAALAPTPSVTAVQPVAQVILPQTPFLGSQVQVRQQGLQAQVSLMAVAPTDFSIQALRRSDIKTYRMTVTWPGNATGLSATRAANADGSLPGNITVNNIPSGDFRVVILDALDSNGDPILDLRAGHVYHQSGTGSVDVTTQITRTGKALAETLAHFSNSTAPGDISIFNVWKANPTATLNDLAALIATLLTGKDPIALDTATLITAIQNVGNGTLPVAGNVGTSSSSPVTLTYTIPSGYYLPAGARLSLNTASSAVVETTVEQQAGEHTLTFPNVYLPLSGTEQERSLRLFAAASSTVIDGGALTLVDSGIKAGTAGSATQALVLPTAMLSAFSETSTFYVDATVGVGSDANTGIDAANAWATLSHALTEVKTKAANNELGTYEGNLTVDFPVRIVGTNPQTTVLDGSGTGTGLNIVADANHATTSDARIVVENLRLNGFNTAILLDQQFITLKHVYCTGNDVAGTYGLWVPHAASVDDLIIEDSQFDHFAEGLTVNSGHTDDTTTFSNVQIRNTSFSENLIKGVYLEKATHVTFDTITIANSGTKSDANNTAGFELNLTGQTSGGPKVHEHITLTNSTITGSGTTGTSWDDDSQRWIYYGRAAVNIKARENAATSVVVSNITLSNNTISGPMQALRIGSPDDNLLDNPGQNGISDSPANASMISGLTLTNNQLILEDNPSFPGSLSRFWLINHTRAEINAANNHFGGVLPSNASCGTEVDGINAGVLDGADFDVYETNRFEMGAVLLGLPPCP